MSLNSPERSPLEQSRWSFQPACPDQLKPLVQLRWKPDPACRLGLDPQIANKLPKLPQDGGQPFLDPSMAQQETQPLRVGVVLSGGPAAGGHNVLWGLRQGLIDLNPKSQLIGFLGGPSGILENRTKPLTEEVLAPYRNQGGFDLLGSGRTKIESPEQLAQALEVCKQLELDGLVVVGGDDSNTNAALLAQAALERGVALSVIGVPKTIDGDLQNPYEAISFGFDTATKVYAEAIGNLGRDGVSAGKYFHFVKLMGRSASHITLECALQTQAPYALIGEEIQAKKLRLKEIVQDLAQWAEQRIQHGRPYGVVLVPEGLVEFIPEFQVLIQELNARKVLEGGEAKEIAQQLTEPSRELYLSLPEAVIDTLLSERDPHGNLQLSALTTEAFLAELVREELVKQGTVKGFQPVHHFLGYEGRCSMPSNFDATYCYALGRAAASLVSQQWTGYMACIQGLAGLPSHWTAYAVPIVRLMHLELRNGKEKPVIAKAYVDLQGKTFQAYAAQRFAWRERDSTIQPGPLQFYGPIEVTWRPPAILIGSA
ncbi:MAG: diphosphate--fructose-6-phosphate 1-phosphotransferase [Chlamydiia bacterium]